MITFKCEICKRETELENTIIIYQCKCGAIIRVKKEENEDD